MDMHGPTHPGKVLRKHLPPGMNVSETARRLGVTRQALEALLNGRSDMSVEMARRLESALGRSAPALPISIDFSSHQRMGASQYVPLLRRSPSTIKSPSWTSCSSACLASTTSIRQSVTSFCMSGGEREGPKRSFTKARTNSESFVQSKGTPRSPMTLLPMGTGEARPVSLNSKSDVILAFPMFLVFQFPFKGLVFPAWNTVFE